MAGHRDEMVSYEQSAATREHVLSMKTNDDKYHRLKGDLQQ